MIVFENERVTFQQCMDQALKVAGILRDKYNITKGDRVAIVSRNYPEFISTFWGIQLLGGVSVMVNAWLPQVPLYHSVAHANSKVSGRDLQPEYLAHTMISKVIFVDAERAPILDISQLRREAGTVGFIVFRPHEGKIKLDQEWKDWEKTFRAYSGNVKEILEMNPGVVPEDNATIFFTSGTLVGHYFFDLPQGS
jgi:acyl-CoA synthetase (AMP-forming)/AMP-acid ligase II